MEKKRWRIVKTIWCIVLSIALAAGSSSMVFANSEGNAQKNIKKNIKKTVR